MTYCGLDQVARHEPAQLMNYHRFLVFMDQLDMSQDSTCYVNQCKEG